MATVARWLHIYLSMFGFATIFFFSVTGITLNHPTWFGFATDRHTDFQGQVDATLLAGNTQDDGGVDRLMLAEFLRKQHSLKGSVTDFRADEFECSITWKSPGYAADAVVDRESKQYRLTVVEHGLVPLINDLHKGRDSGAVWSVVIDVSALLMAISSVTGVVLLFYIKRKLVPGLWTALAGAAALLALYLFGVP